MKSILALGSRSARPPLFFSAALVLGLAAVAGCDGGGGGGTGGTAGAGGDGTGAGSTSDGGGGSGAAGGGGGSPVCGPDVEITPTELPDATDPEAGMFTLEEALAELPEGPGPLRAIIDTDAGTMTCTLEPDKVPIGVANFVGLARGRRPWKDPAIGKWVKRRFYDGLLFHRVIPQFVAQGGDPLGTGFGGPGYKFADEIVGLSHKAGTLAYANSGPNTNGSQFYITETPQPQLDSGYVIIGFCEPVTVVNALTAVPTDGNDKPLTDLHMKTITITRCAP